MFSAGISCGMISPGRFRIESVKVSWKLNKSRGLKVKSLMYREHVGPGISPGDHRSALDNT